MKKVMFLFAVVLMIVTGCNSNTVDVESSADALDTVSEDDVKVTVDSSLDSEGQWCAKGTKVKTQTSEGDVNAEVKGVIDSGKYAGYCHMVSSFQGSSGTMNIDYYYDESGSGYQVIDVNGQTIETEWTNTN